MGNSMKTAEKHYYMRQKVKTLAKANKVIRFHFYGLETISPIKAPTTPKKKWNEKKKSIKLNAYLVKIQFHLMMRALLK